MSARAPVFERFFARIARRHSASFVALGVALSLAFALSAAFASTLFAGLDHFFLDRLLAHTANHQRASHVVVVDIDEMSLAAVGQWPWPRYKVAALLTAIDRAKPAAIGLDLLFPEADRTSLANIQGDFRREFGVNLGISGVPAGLSDNDGYLGYVMSESSVVAANYFYFDHVTRNELYLPIKPEIDAGGHPLLLPKASGMMTNTRAIASQSDFTGFLNTQPDSDGVIRRLPLLIGYHDRIYPDLALATVMKALDVSKAFIDSSADGSVIRVGAHDIPIDREGNAILRFNGRPELYPSVSAVDVLNGKVLASDFAGKMVFIGASAAGLSDLHSTAFDPFFSGLKLQAMMAENIVSDSFVVPPSWATIAIILECLVTGVFLTALFTTAGGALVTVIGSGLASLIPLLVSLILFDTRSIFLSPAAPVALAATLIVLFSMLRFAIEQRLAFVRLKRLENSRQVTIESMAAVAETRDPDTGAHIKRTQHYVKAIALALKHQGRHADVITPDFIDMLFLSAPLHDIGKVGVPDHILLKPGKLTEEEFEIMKQHAEFGRRIILSTAQLIEGDNYLKVGADIAGAHHEKWDGTGYPLGLSGEDIPLAGRIMAIADMYDALISRRCYKEPFPHAAALDLMREARGKTFDPGILDTFFSIEATILEIAARYSDATAPEIKDAELEAERNRAFASAARAALSVVK